MPAVFYLKEVTPYGMVVFLAETLDPKDPNPLRVAVPVWGQYEMLPTSLASCTLRATREDLALSGAELLEKLTKWAEKLVEIEKERKNQGLDNFLPIKEKLLQRIKDDFKDVDYWDPAWHWTTLGP